MAAPSSQDLVFTLFGDYLLAREKPVWVGSLIVLLGRLGLAEPATRTALSRMTKRGWLVASRRGSRGYYSGAGSPTRPRGRVARSRGRCRTRPLYAGRGRLTRARTGARTP